MPLWVWMVLCMDRMVLPPGTLLGPILSLHQASLLLDTLGSRMVAGMTGKCLSVTTSVFPINMEDVPMVMTIMVYTLVSMARMSCTIVAFVGLTPLTTSAMTQLTSAEDPISTAKNLLEEIENKEL